MLDFPHRMKLHGDLTINGHLHPAGSEIAWYRIYPFFLFHMLMFGGSGFFIAYGQTPVSLPALYACGGFAIFIYTVFYFAIFGVDEVKWMFINAALGVLGIYAQVGWLLKLFGRDIEDYPLKVHTIPFLYYVLYTFMLRQALLDITGTREEESGREKVGYAYIAGQLLFSLACWLLS